MRIRSWTCVARQPRSLLQLSYADPELEGKKPPQY